MTDLSKLKVAVVHDWLIGGGAELVVQELHRMFPEAPIYASYATREWRQKLDGKVITGALQHWPFSRLRKFLPLLRIWWFSRLKLTGYDLVISSSGAEAKGIHVSANTLHVNYCHAPTHYYWSRYEQYMQHPGFGLLDPLARLGLKLLVGPLRRWDYRAAQRPDYMIANSKHIQADIKKYYGRRAQVIYPPVHVERFQPTARHERFGFVTAGRQAPYKRIDLAVAACSQLDLPLTVIGTGPEHNKLAAMAGPSVRFLTQVDDAQIVHHFQRAEAFLFPGLDDFGIVAVEALAAGTPVIAYRGGGALEYVSEAKTGRLFEPQTVDGLMTVLETFQLVEYDSQTISRSASRFAARKFTTSMQKFLEKTVRSNNRVV